MHHTQHNTAPPARKYSGSTAPRRQQDTTHPPVPLTQQPNPTSHRPWPHSPCRPPLQIRGGTAHSSECTAGRHVRESLAHTHFAEHPLDTHFISMPGT